VRRISFDHAVLERSDRVLAVRGRFGWSDVGSWHALDAHLPRRGRDRVAGSGPLVTLDSSDNLVWNSTGKAVALVGLSDVVIVNTDDALLVCPKSRTQDVRRIVDELKRRRLAELL
jgi:mannose-1-phosphate guanylyltransferase